MNIREIRIIIPLFKKLFLNLFIKKIKLIVIILIAFVFTTKAQDALFTNTQQSLLYLNPSFAGSNGFIRHQSVFRNQWPNLSGSYVTFYNGFDMYIKKLKGGLGLTYLKDDQANGTLVTDRIDLTYAQHFSFMEGNLKIIPSLQATYFQKHLDNTKLIFGSQIDPRRGFGWVQTEPIPYQTKRNVDFSSGILVNYKHFYFGTSVFHINQPDEGLLGSSKLPVRLSMFASGYIPIGEKSLLNILIRYERQIPFYYYQLCANVLLYKHLIIGYGYKTNNCLHGNIGFRHNYFSIIASYARYLDFGNYAYELTASFNLRNKEQSKQLVDFEKW